LCIKYIRNQWKYEGRGWDGIKKYMPF